MKIKRNSKSLRVNKLTWGLNIRIYLIILLSSVGLNSYGQLVLNSPNTTGVYKAPFSIKFTPGFSSSGPLNASIEQGYLTEGSPTNFTSIWTLNSALTTAPALKAQENNSSIVNISTKFVDGLGRLVQTVEKAQSVNNTDLVQPYEYDDLGRQVKQYLPYANSSSGAYHLNATSTEQAGFYNSGSTINPQSNNPFSKVLFDNSPLDRPIEQGSPGDSWQLTGSTAPNSGHTSKLDYVSNNITGISDVANTRIAVAYGVAIDVNGSRSLAVYGDGGYYAENDLYVKVSKDPNWIATDGRNGTIEVFTNKAGKTVLKRAFVKNPSGNIDIISTYFVYDDFGNLCYVLPQAANPDLLSASNGANISAATLNTVCYQYQYDEKQRLIAKRLPGKDWEYMVYNELNQLVASQDGNQRPRNEWSVKKYDGLGRTIITGVWNNNNTFITRDNLQAILNQQTTLYESRISTSTGYSTNAWPQNIASFYTIDYFDDYNVPGVPTGYGYQTYAGNPGGYSNQTQGLPTISRTWPLSNSAIGLWSFNYYDIKGRVIQAQSVNHLSGKDIYNNEYDFNGKITKSVRVHSSSAGSITITNRFTYDHHGREIQHYEQIGSDPEVLLSQLTYNDLGQIVDKKLHQKSGNSKFIQSIDYRYNIRGWLTSINDPSLAANSGTNPDDSNTNDADKFGMTLKYDQAEQSQYNGNIGSTQWAVAKPTGSSLTSPMLKYDYTYDKLDRLVAAASSTGTTKDENFSEYLSYDKMGNILSLSRWAKLAAGKTQVDNLSYLYTTGNQVNQIDDASNNNTYGFKENGSGAVSKQANEYVYDLSGNLIKDLNKGITSITYNNFNLPLKITWSDGRTLVYDYDGNGGKLKKVYTVGSNVFTTDYVNGLQYEQGQIAFINTAEGIARKNTGGSNYIYQYFIKDQIGNNRVVIQPVYPAETTADIIQMTNYYAYGLEFQSDDPTALFGYVSGPKNNYLFNDKELQDGLELYDFGARDYDPKTGRWNAPDPANQFQDESPYAALGNNPIIHVDPDGRFLNIVIGAVIGAVVNVGIHAIQGKIKGPGDVFAAALIGGGAGALAGATGGLSLVAEGATGLAAVGSSFVVGAAAGAESALVQGVGNALYFGDSFSAKDVIVGAATGGVVGAAFKGLQLAFFSGKGTSIGTGPGVAGDPEAAARQIENNALVKLDEETLTQSAYKAPEIIDKYTIWGTKGIVGDTYNRNIFLIKTPKEFRSLSALKALMKTFESEAVAAGASKISIYGAAVINKGFLNPAIVTRLGYTFEKSGAGVILQKVLK